jgi:hypothetical protein
MCADSLFSALVDATGQANSQYLRSCVATSDDDPPVEVEEVGLHTHQVGGDQIMATHAISANDEDALHRKQL